MQPSPGRKASFTMANPDKACKAERACVYASGKGSSDMPAQAWAGGGAPVAACANASSKDGASVVPGERLGTDHCEVAAVGDSASGPAPAPRRTFWVGVACALMGAGLWGVSGACAQYLFAHYGITPMFATAVRSLVASLIFFGVLFFRRRYLLRLMWGERTSREASVPCVRRGAVR